MIDYAKLCKNGLAVLEKVIANGNPENFREEVKELLHNFALLAEATKQALSQNQREEQAYLELLNRTQLLIVKTNKEKERLQALVDQDQISLSGNNILLEKNKQELRTIRAEILKITTEIERLKPKASFQWWYIFCWLCAIAHKVITDQINERLSDIEKLDLQAKMLEAACAQGSVAEYSALIKNLRIEIAKDQNQIAKLKENQLKLERLAKIYSIKTATTLKMEREIVMIQNSLEGLYKNKDYLFLIKSRLASNIYFGDGKTEANIPLREAILKWGTRLNEELRATGKNVRAVALAIGGKEFGHMRQVSQDYWEFIPSANFASLKNNKIVSFLNNNQFKETLRDAWTVYAMSKGYTLHINIWLNKVTLINNSTSEKHTAEIIDGSLFEKIKFYKQDGINANKITALCDQNNWRLASSFEITVAWMHDKLHVFAFGRLRDGLLATPIQHDVNKFKKGLNIKRLGEENTGNQGFFYIEGDDHTHEKIKMALA